ncbi:serine hydrolase domain-containing protein [Streptomyces paromomycinus]|uniref:Serine hydrolase n=1 Tax=Streptomyces paromomycinus TaxID=92743 RepID=A0A401VVN2_STREY|nr:serine hydrolase domain-containing protein [Streptomyces paromomycinus]GCD41132.1 serine hydrolase [Streptomyces paromomycinus]
MLATASVVLALVAPVAEAAGTGAGAAGTAGRPSGSDACAAARSSLAASLDTLVTRHGIPGVAAGVTDPRCGRWDAARGVADRKTGRPMRAEDRFRIGSVTKTFTATVVLQLAAEGRIELDAPVERYLPGLIRGGNGHGYDGRRITVRQLLQHTSGLPDYTTALVQLPLDQWRFRHFEPRELIATALKMPPPEKKWHYSTTNYLLAGLVVEKITGRGAEAEVSRRILRPLGLRDTYWPGDSTRIRGAHSRSYFSATDDPDAPLADGTEWNMTFGGVGGALVSTPADVNRFFRGLFGGKLLPARWLAEMKRTVPADPDRLWPGARYGLGLIASPLECGGWWWGHGGTVPGGHRALGAVGPGGRSVALALTAVPSTEQAESAYRATAETAFCAPTGEQQLKEAS